MGKNKREVMMRQLRSKLLFITSDFLLIAIFINYFSMLNSPLLQLPLFDRMLYLAARFIGWEEDWGCMEERFCIIRLLRTVLQPVEWSSWWSLPIIWLAVISYQVLVEISFTTVFPSPALWDTHGNYSDVLNGDFMRLDISRTAKAVHLWPITYDL